MRSAVLRLVTPIVWRVPGHGARKLYGFARAEQGSRIDLLHAAHRTTSAARRVLYLRHALDETRHAAMFWRRSTDLRAAAGRDPFPAPVADTERLFERLGEVRFLAFVHRGERRGRQQFERYARHFGARGDARTQALFEAILVDEHRHESYTRALLVELAGSEQAACAALRRAALWEAWRMWRRAGRTLATAVYTLAMIAIYLVAGLIAVAATLGRRRNRRAVQWHLPASRLAALAGPDSPCASALTGLASRSSAPSPSIASPRAAAASPSTASPRAAAASPGIASPPTAAASPSTSGPTATRELS